MRTKLRRVLSKAGGTGRMAASSRSRCQVASRFVFFGRWVAAMAAPSCAAIVGLSVVGASEGIAVGANDVGAAVTRMELKSCWSACCVCFAPLASASAHRRRAAAFIAVVLCRSENSNGLAA